ncbi:hypothetical protein RJ641_007946 [Dillenia turbinata]|uniref:Uncharacterized protein n=1 Tax=Dillenia turbinata TaxID=194707 RepID=A0AAN8VBC8_9MAGN
MACALELVKREKDNGTLSNVRRGAVVMCASGGGNAACRGPAVASIYIPFKNKRGEKGMAIPICLAPTCNGVICG